MKDIRNIFNIREKKSKSLFTIWEVVVISLAFSIILSVITGFICYNINRKSILDDKAIEDIVDTYKKIKNEYYEDIDINNLADSAIDGMMGYLNEQYSVYMNGTDTDSLNDKLKGNYEGIGILISKYVNGKVEIQKVYDDTPAEKAGLESGDIIKRVNNLEVKNDTTNEEIVSAIQESSEATIVVLRDKKELEFKVKKDIVDNPVVETKVFEKNDKKIGYLYLSAFNASADKQVRKSLVKLENEEIDSLILDLRSNTGGYLNIATNIANMFLKKGKIIYSLEGKSTKETVFDDTKEMRNYDIVVLMDAHTASASEILAASLKESYGAILIGSKSYGKGKVQQTSTLSDETMIKYTTAKWFTPNGDNIDSIGLTPGIEIQLTQKYAQNPSDENDTQLQKAIEVLSSK